MSLFKRMGMFIFVAFIFETSIYAQDHKATAMQYIDDNATLYGDVAQQIWDWAEVGYLEPQSSNLLQQQLSNAGFEITTGVAGIPTAFVASWSAGTGGPIVGILAEYDALPGITQDRYPLRDAIDHKAAGHACGHHLFGTGSVAAAIATRMRMQETGQNGEIRLYGTQAEEAGAGKV